MTIHLRHAERSCARFSAPWTSGIFECRMGGTTASVRPASIAPPAPSQGQLIDGKYRVQGPIGEGAMGTVLAAHHELLDIPVAVKLMSPTLLAYPQIVERFLREARAAARLKSEHVARVMDVGQLPDGQPYIVMELLEGEDLEQRIARTGALPVAQAVDFTLQALEAMAHAHARQIVHRDLKPANLFVTQTADGREAIKVLDFGIAKLADVADVDPAPSAKVPTSGPRVGRLTAENQTLGSPSYMAPEQMAGRADVDVRADIWAVGAILYEMLTGRTAFGGDTIGEIFAAVLRHHPPPMNTVRPDLPEGLVAAVGRCLRRERDERFHDVGELAEAIAPWASPEQQVFAIRIEETLEHITELTNPGQTDSVIRSFRSLGRLAVPTPGIGFRPIVTPHEPFSVPGRRQMSEASTQLQMVHAPRVARRRGGVGGGIVLVATIALMTVGDYRVDTTSMRARESAQLVPNGPAGSATPASSVAPPLSAPVPSPSHGGKTVHPTRKPRH
ncbi:MAG TPA: serine/threonine-protein kinase [Polyangiaceae bacterium]